MQKPIFRAIAFLCLFNALVCLGLPVVDQALNQGASQSLASTNQDCKGSDKDKKQLEFVLAEFCQQIEVANDQDSKEKAIEVYKCFCDELFSSPEVLFGRYCPSASVLCKYIFPSFSKEKVILFVNFIIDQINVNPAFCFNKKLQDFWSFDLEVLLRELNIYLAYFASTKEFKGSETHLRLKALVLDFLFFKAYICVLKDKVNYKDLDAVDKVVRLIKPIIQAMVNTKYEHYYRERLEMLNLVLTKVGDSCY